MDGDDYMPRTDSKGPFGPLDRRVADRIGSHLGDLIAVDAGSDGAEWICDSLNPGHRFWIGRSLCARIH
jgi:hypothetical protein